jgi:hypothetical protein
MSGFFRAGWLAAWTPVASAAVYYGWLASDSGGFQPCDALSLAGGFIPFFVLPTVTVAVKTRLARRSWSGVAGLVAVPAVASIAALVFVWLVWFGKDHCGE